MKKAIKPLSAITFATVLAASGAAWAGGSHGHDDDHGDDHHTSEMKHDDHGEGMGGDHHGSGEGHDDGHGHGSAKGGMFLVKKEIDGYNVSFHVMKAKSGKEMGGTHDFMIKIEKDGKALTNVVVNTRVKHPSGEAESKKAMKMGDWMMAGYDLGHPGKHQLMILFKTADGAKHKGGVYYP